MTLLLILALLGVIAKIIYEYANEGGTFTWSGIFLILVVVVGLFAHN